MKEQRFFPGKNFRFSGMFALFILQVLGAMGQTSPPPLQELFRWERAAQATGAWSRLETRRERLNTAAKQHSAIALSVEWVGTADSCLVMASNFSVRPGWNRLALLNPEPDPLTGAGNVVWRCDGVPLSPSEDGLDSVWVEPTSGGVWVEAEFQGPAQGIFLTLRETCAAPEPVPGPWPASDGAFPFWLGTFAGTIPITGDCFVHHSPDGVFDKPLIIIEGFDPGLSGETPTYGTGDMNWEVLWNCGDALIPNTESMPTLLDSLGVLGMDLVYLDFHQGTRAVSQQAALVQELIRRCRDHKVGEFPMVLVGASMGGLVARHSLRQMELAGESHCTGLFIALDSPFRGAYLPIGMQQAIAFFAEHDVQAAALAAALGSPAAQTLLLTGPAGPSPAFLELQALMQSQGLPQEPMNLAVANSDGSSPFPLEPGPLYQGVVNWLGWELAHLQINRSPGDPYHTASTPEAHVLFDCDLPNGEWNGWNGLYLSATGMGPADAPAWEAMPGSYSMHLASFRQAMEAAGLETAQSQDATMFIPTRSALDLPVLGPEPLGASLFDAYHLEPAGIATRGHCDVTNHLDFLWEWLGQAWANPEEEGGAGRHWGWQNPTRRTVPSWTLPTGAWASIGSPMGNGFASPSAQPFEVETGVCADTIRIQAGAELHIGDAQGLGLGRLRVRAGALLLLDSGATLHIHPGSALILEAGATCIAEGAAIRVGNGGTLQTLAGSDLTFNSSPQLQLNGPDARWRHAGLARILAGETLQTHSPNAAMGRVQWEGPQGRVLLSQNARWELNGASPGDGPNPENDGNPGTGMEILALSTARILGAGGVASFQSTAIQWQAGAQWFCESNLLGMDASLRGTSDAQLVTSGRFRWENGEVERVTHTHQHPSAASFLLRSSTVLKSHLHASQSGVRIINSNIQESAIDIENPSHAVRLQGSNWMGGMGGHPAQVSIHGSNAAPAATSIADCQFTSHSVGIEAIEQALELECNSFHQLGSAIVCAQCPSMDLSPGGNVFEHNDVHLRLMMSEWPLLTGGNAWLTCNNALFYGSVNLPCPNQPTSYLLTAVGENWAGSTSGVPWQVTPIQLSFAQSPCPGGNSNLMVKDLSPGIHKPCSGHTPPQQATSPKELKRPEEARIGPNPAFDQVQINLPKAWDPTSNPCSAHLLDLKGRWIQTFPIPDVTHNISLVQLGSGIYFLQLENGTTRERITLPLVIHK